MVRVTQKSRVHKRKMRHIQKVFDNPWTVRMNSIGSTMHFAKRRVIPFWSHWHSPLRAPERHPDPAILLLRLVHYCVCLCRGNLLWMRRETDASPLFIIRPAMI